MSKTYQRVPYVPAPSGAPQYVPETIDASTGLLGLIGNEQVRKCFGELPLKIDVIFDGAGKYLTCISPGDFYLPSGFGEAMQEVTLKQGKAIRNQEHYASHKIQPATFIAANNLDFFQGNVVKYVVRYKKKNGVEDLEKAKHYLDMLIQKEETGEVTF